MGRDTLPERMSREGLIDAISEERGHLLLSEGYKSVIEIIGSCEEAKSALFEMFSFLTDPVFFIDSNMIIKWLNAAAVVFVRHAIDGSMCASDIVGGECYKAMKADFVCEGCAVLQAMKEGRIVDKKQPSPANPSVVFDVVAIPLMNGMKGCLEIVRA